MENNGFPKYQEQAIIRADDLSDPSVRHEEAGPAASQHVLRALGTRVRSPWKTPGIMTRLHEYAKDKLTSRQMMVRLNHEFSVELTRKAIIGQLNRQGIAPNQLAPKQQQNKPVKGHSHQVLQLRPKLVVEEIAEPVPRGDVDSGCRYLHGDAAARNFCGAPSDGPWCKYHHRKVYSVNQFARKAQDWRPKHVHR